MNLSIPHLSILATQLQIVAGDFPFYALAICASLAALAVVISRNIVRTAVFLLFALASVSGLYFLLDAEFLAAVQLVIYAGGTLILIIFGVMLTSRSQFARFHPRNFEIVLAALIGTLMLGALVAAILSAQARGVFRQSAGFPSAEYRMQDLGAALLADYLLPFELISVVLLVVMIGAAFLAKGRRRRQDNRPAAAPSAASSTPGGATWN